MAVRPASFAETPVGCSDSRWTRWAASVSVPAWVRVAKCRTGCLVRPAGQLHFATGVAAVESGPRWQMKMKLARPSLAMFAACPGPNSHHMRHRRGGVRLVAMSDWTCPMSLVVEDCLLHGTNSVGRARATGYLLTAGAAREVLATIRGPSRVFLWMASSKMAAPFVHLRCRYRQH